MNTAITLGRASSFSRGLFGALLAISALAVSHSAAAQSPFRIAGVVSLSGTYGIYGEDLRKGVDLAVAQRKSVLGRPIQVEWDDTQSKVELASQKTVKAASSRVNLLVGSSASGETAAMAQIAEQRKIPHLITQSSADVLTSKGYRYIVKTREKWSNEVLAIQRYIQGQKAKSVYAVVGDVGVFRDSWKSMRDGFAQAGIQVKGEDMVPFGSTDYSVPISKAAASGADVLVLMIAGNDAVTFIKQASGVNLSDRMSIAGPAAMDESMLKATGAAAMGVVTAIGYHSDIDTPANKAFVAAYTKAYGVRPSYAAGEAYDALQWAFDTMEASKSVDPDVWIAAIENAERPQGVTGWKKMRWCDHQVDRTSYLAQVKKGPGGEPELKLISSWKGKDFGQADCPAK